MEPGPLLAEGATCRVYGWGTDRVVKVYRRAFAYLAPVEAERAAAVHEAGVPSPAPYGLVEVGERVGLVFDRVGGPSLLDELMARVRSPADVGREVAQLQSRIHSDVIDDVPDLADTMAERGVPGLPVGAAPFHGDFHPGNVLRHDDRLVVVDWSNAHRAPPAADVACSILAIGWRGLRRDHPDVDRAHRARERLLDAYVAAYEAIRPDVMAGVPLWLRAIGQLLLEQEPETAYADELRDRARL